MNIKNQIELILLIFFALKATAEGNTLVNAQSYKQLAKTNLTQPASKQLTTGTKISRLGLKQLKEGNYLLTVPSQPVALFKKGPELWIVSSRSLPVLPPEGSKLKFKVIRYQEGLAVTCNFAKLLCLRFPDGRDVKLSQTPLETTTCKQLQDGYHWPLPCPYSAFTLGDLYVVALEKSGLGAAREIEFGDLTQLATIQGLVFFHKTSKPKVFEHPDGISIQTNCQRETEQSLESSLPWRFEEGDFLQQKKDLERAIARAPSTKEAYVCTSRLAKHHFSRGQYNEAASIIREMDTYPELADDLNMQFILAAAEYALGHKQAAANVLSTIARKTCSRTLEREMLLFDALSRDNPMELSLLEFDGFLKEYHEEVYWNVAFDVMGKELESLNLLQLESLLNQVRLPKSPYGLNGMKYYEGMLLLKLGKKQEACCKLEKVEQSRFKTLAIVELVKVRLEQQSITTQEAVGELEKLRLSSIVDNKSLNKIILELAGLYSSLGEHISELRTLRRFKGDGAAIRVSEAYEKAFLTKNTNYTPLQMVAAFNEFRDLLPAGYQGDKVVFSIVQELVSLDLLELAEEILSHQVTYRLSGDTKSAAANYLACIMMMNGKAQKALDLLNKASLGDMSLAKHQVRSRLKAVACIELGKYEHAIAYLEGDNSLEAFNLKKEALFNAQKWQEYAALAAPPVLSLTSGKAEELPDWAVRDAIRLSLSYLMLNSSEKNSFLAERIRKINAELANDIASLRSPSALEGYKKLYKKATRSIELKDYCQQAFLEAYSKFGS